MHSPDQRQPKSPNRRSSPIGNKHSPQGRERSPMGRRDVSLGGKRLRSPHDRLYPCPSYKKDVKAQEGDKILLLKGQIVDDGKSQSL